MSFRVLSGSPLFAPTNEHGAGGGSVQTSVAPAGAYDAQDTHVGAGLTEPVALPPEAAKFVERLGAAFSDRDLRESFEGWLVPYLATAGTRKLAAVWQMLEDRRIYKDHLPPDAYGRADGTGVVRDIFDKSFALLTSSQAGGSYCFEGLQHLRTVLREARKGRPIMLVGNHVSIGDTNLLYCGLSAEVEKIRRRQHIPHDPLLSVHDTLLSRTVVLAGLKVYLDRTSLLASLMFNTLRTPQSISASSGAMKDLLDAASRKLLLESMASSITENPALRPPHHILVYLEGKRNPAGMKAGRTFHLLNWLQDRDYLVLPVATSGSESMVLLDERDSPPTPVFHPGSFRVAFGRPYGYQELLGACSGNNSQVRAKQAMHAMNYTIANLLPEESRGDGVTNYRGSYSLTRPVYPDAYRLAQARFEPVSP